MTKEHEQRPSEGFPLMEHERLFDRLSDTRVQKLLFDTQTKIHEIKVDANSFGEFLFITASRPKEQGREVLTFWGLGFHEYRERWYTEEWVFHETYPSPKSLEQQLSYEDAKQQMQERRKDIQAEANNPSTQSKMGALFEILADLTDEDGALSELEDLGSHLFFLDDNDEI